MYAASAYAYLRIQTPGSARVGVGREKKRAHTIISLHSPEKSRILLFMTSKTNQNVNRKHAGLDISAHPMIGGMLTNSLDMSSAREYADLLLSNDNTRTHVTITYTEQCAECGGSGGVRKAHTRVHFATIKCKCCGGTGGQFSELLETISRS